MGRARQWGLLTALGVAGVCVAFVVAPPATAPDRAFERLIVACGAVAVTAAVALAVGSAIGRALTTRRTRRRALVDDLRTRFLDAGLDPDHRVAVRRWSGRVPTKVVVTLPRRIRADGPLPEPWSRDVAALTGERAVRDGAPVEASGPQGRRAPSSGTQHRPVEGREARIGFGGLSFRGDATVRQSGGSIPRWLWAPVCADSLVPGDVVHLGGEPVLLTDVHSDPVDAGSVVLSWGSGSVAMPARDAVPRAA